MNQKSPFRPDLIQSKNEKKTLLGGAQNKENKDPKMIIIFWRILAQRVPFNKPKLVDVKCCSVATK